MARRVRRSALAQLSAAGPGMWRVVGLSILAAMAVVALVSSVATAQPAISPELRDAVKSGRMRVLVELRIGTPASPGVATPEAIAEVQRQVLARLGSSGVSPLRRYSSIPWLTLEIDADALARLEAMGDLVLRVLPDTRLRPSARPVAVERDAGWGVRS